MIRILLAAFAFAALSASAEARSKAAEYLIAQEIAEACDGGGQIDPPAVIERDLTGDGNADLIIAHEGISCSGGGRSGYCGIQVCSFKIYVREGALLQPKVEMLGMGISLGTGAIPEIRWHAHGGAPQSMSWQGGSFR